MLSFCRIAGKFLTCAHSLKAKSVPVLWRLRVFLSHILHRSPRAFKDNLYPGAGGLWACMLDSFFHFDFLCKTVKISNFRGAHRIWARNQNLFSQWFVNHLTEWTLSFIFRLNLTKIPSASPFPYERNICSTIFRLLLQCTSPRISAKICASIGLKSRLGMQFSFVPSYFLSLAVSYYRDRGCLFLFVLAFIFCALKGLWAKSPPNASSFFCICTLGRKASTAVFWVYK